MVFNIIYLKMIWYLYLVKTKLGLLLMYLGVAINWMFFCICGSYYYELYIHYSNTFKYGWIIYLICFLGQIILTSSIFRVFQKTRRELYNANPDSKEDLLSGYITNQVEFKANFFIRANSGVFLIYTSYILYSLIGFSLFGYLIQEYLIY